MYSKRNTYILIAAALLVAFVVGFISYEVHKTPAVHTPDTTALTYTSDTYGITFNYPSTYTLTQKDVTDPKNKALNHHEVTLTNSSAQVPNNGEAPTAITFEFYTNPKGGLIQDWVKNTDASNYKLAVDPKFQETLIGGTPAYAYTWSGLYNGNTFVFEHNGYIVMATGTYLTTDDQILGDFTLILSTIELR